jgi:predicted glycosyltransferase
MVTSRDKEMALELLNELGIRNEPLSSLGKGGMASLAKELIQRDIRLYRVVRTFGPDVMAAIGGTFIAHVGFFTRTPSLVFYDTENARLQNSITYPLASCIFAPRCYEAWLPRARHVRYAGYHELSYLRPPYFTPDRAIAQTNGLAGSGDTFFLRLVSWQANHDVAERGWSEELLRAVLAVLASRGRVLVSSEAPLPADLEQYRYPGSPAQVHHVMAFCRLLVGESATMASESAILGVPAVYAARTGRGYTNEQERRYGLVANVRSLATGPLVAAIERMLAQPPAHWAAQRARLLADTIDVAAYVTEVIETYPEPLRNYHQARAA